MFVGHGALAFAAVGLLALRAGADRRRATALAVVAALFATVPDVDMVYAVTGLLGGPLGEPVALATSFWAASTVVHRSITHSLVIAAPAAVAFALVGRTRARSAVAVPISAGIVAVALLDTGPLAGLVALSFALAGSLVGLGAARYGLAERPVLGAALFGLVSHPFGDVLTGQPPELFYPVDVHLLTGRVALSADPTLHLLGAFAVELATIWAALVVVAHLRGTRVRDRIRPRAAVGAAYAIAVFLVPPPTLELSYPFVFGVLGVGMVGAVPRRRGLPDRFTAIATGLAGVTVALLAYAAAYLTIGVGPLPP